MCEHMVIKGGIASNPRPLFGTGVLLLSEKGTFQGTALVPPNVERKKQL